MSDSPVYVYGVVPGERPLRIAAAGVGGGKARVRTIDHGGIAALVSEAPGEPLRAARDVRLHWAVLEEAIAGTTVLPVRFGTVMADEAALHEEFLEPQRDHLTELLRELDGTVQLSVKAFYADEERILAQIVRDSPRISMLSARVRRVPAAASYYDRIHLGELVVGEFDRRRAQDTEWVLARLQPLARRATTEPPPAKDGAVNAAFLVERSRVDEFAGAVRQLAKEVEETMRIRFVGPLPPYSFAGEQTMERGPAWA